MRKSANRARRTAEWKSIQFLVFTVQKEATGGKHVPATSFDHLWFQQNSQIQGIISIFGPLRFDGKSLYDSLFMYTLHMCHYAQSYYNFDESLSAPCLFYRYDFQMILFQRRFINKLSCILSSIKKNTFLLLRCIDAYNVFLLYKGSWNVVIYVIVKINSYYKVLQPVYMLEK